MAAAAAGAAEVKVVDSCSYCELLNHSHFLLVVDLVPLGLLLYLVGG